MNKKVNFKNKYKLEHSNRTYKMNAMTQTRIDKWLLFIKKNWLLILLALWIALIYCPSLLLNFSLIDDGYTVKLSRELVNLIRTLDFRGIYNLIFESASGRVRPVYWLMQTFLSSIVFYNSHAIHALRLVQLMATLVVSYKILEKLKITHYLIFLSLFVFATNIQNFENYYRAGPAETFQTLFYVISIYLVFFAKENIFNLSFLAIATFFSVFIKETYFLSVLPLGFSYLFIQKGPNKKLKMELKNKFIITIITLLGSTALFLFIKSAYPPLEISAYTNHYQITIPILKQSLEYYKNNLLHFQYPFFQLSLFHLFYFVYLKIKNRKRLISNKLDAFYITLWLVAISQFAALLPWEFALPRYLLLINVNLVLIYGLVFRDIFLFLQTKIPHILRKPKIDSNLINLLSVLIILPVFLVRNYFELANYQLLQKTGSDVSYGLVNSLSRAVPKNQTVFVNFKRGETTIEIFLETKWHLEEFFGRDDIFFEYLDEDKMCTDKERYILDYTIDRFIEPEEFDNKRKFSEVGGGEAIYRPINYGVVLKSFFAKSKLKGWDNEHKHRWTIYKQKMNTCLDKDLII